MVRTSSAEERRQRLAVEEMAKIHDEETAAMEAAIAETEQQIALLSPRAVDDGGRTAEGRRKAFSAELDAGSPMGKMLASTAEAEEVSAAMVRLSIDPHLPFH